MSLLAKNEWAYNPQQSFFATPETCQIVYERAKSLVLSSGLTVDDIVNLTPKFWDFNLDLTITRDLSAFMIAQNHLNLCVGTIGAHTASRPDLVPLLDDLMAFRTCASFLITEFGHGLDVKNMETTATLLSDGAYDLHTPAPSAAKAMPPTASVARCPRVAIVLARLLVGAEDRGLKLFVVPLASADAMHPGITSWMLPVRPGTTPVDHCLTTFDHVRLPSSALLGDPARARDPGLDLHRLLWRLSVGAMSLSLGHIACLRVGAYVAGHYSKRRHVEQARQGLVPIVSFSTQYRPVLQALVAGEVLAAFGRWASVLFCNSELDMLVRRALAVVFKTTAIHLCRVVPELADRCGWRGFFPHNQLADLYLSFSANGVAEGDVHVLSLRLVFELLSKRYALPGPQDPNAPLAQHEAGLFSELRALFPATPSPAADTFATHGLPRCRGLIVAIGQRMAFEAARSATAPSVSPDILDAFEAISVSDDPSWYVENLSWSRARILDRETAAYETLRPQLDALLARTGARDFITSPLVSDKEWEETVRHCPKFTSAGPVEDDGLGMKPLSTV